MGTTLGTTLHRRQKDAQRGDLLAPDHFPECPRCFELNEPGSVICATCFAPLLLKSPGCRCHPNTSE